MRALEARAIDTKQLDGILPCPYECSPSRPHITKSHETIKNPPLQFFIQPTLLHLSTEQVINNAVDVRIKNPIIVRAECEQCQFCARTK